MKVKFKSIFIRYTAQRYAPKLTLYRPYIVYLDQEYILYELDEYGRFTKKL